MEKKYQLVAWTKNITDKDNARLYVVPSVKHDLDEPLIKEVSECRRQQEKDGGYISTKLARRFIRIYDQSARLEILTGNIDEAIRFFLQAAHYSIHEDFFNWVYYDTDLGSYSHFCGELRHEFTWYCEKALFLAHKYGCKQILEEESPKRTLKLYFENNQEEQDLKRHLREISAWK